MTMTQERAVPLKGERMLSVRETAKIMGWCLDSVRRHLRAGDMPGVRVGRNWRIPESQLAAYMGLNPSESIAPAPTPTASRSSSTAVENSNFYREQDYHNEIVETLLRTSAARAQVLQLVGSAMRNIDASPEIAQQTLKEMGSLLRKL